MSRRFWIRVRILGWTLMFMWFITGEVYLLMYPISQQMVSVVSCLVGAIGTFLVLVGYCMLTREDKQAQSGDRSARTQN